MKIWLIQSFKTDWNSKVNLSKGINQLQYLSISYSWRALARKNICIYIDMSVCMHFKCELSSCFLSFPWRIKH